MRSYLNEYMEREKNDRIHRLSSALGLNEVSLRQLYDAHPTAANINEFGRLDNLISQVDRPKAKAFIESQKGEAISPRSVTAEIYSLLRRFLIGNFEGLFTPATAYSSSGAPSEINIGTNIEHADTVIIHSTPTE